MLIEKPRCNFKNCKYCFYGNCISADKYENCELTDLHYEIAKLTVDRDNAKSKVAREIFALIFDRLLKSFPAQSFIDAPCTTHGRLFDMLDELQKKYTEEKNV